MIPLVVIQEKVNTAKLFYQILLDRYKASLIKGCDDKPSNMDCLRWYILALNSDLRDIINTSKTQAIYNKLIGVLGAYSEAYDVDTNVVIPNTTYEVVNNSTIPPIYITDADFTGDVYTNPELVGMTNFAVFDQNTNRYLINGTEFTYNASGGIIIIGGVYEGSQYFLIF